MIKKGIVLAGGTGSRLYPSTLSVNKQLLMLYDKPVIYYPISILMLAGVKKILIIINSGQEKNFKKILKDGSQWGIKIEYAEQKNPNGIPEAFVIGEKFIGNDNVALILGDNFFYGQSLGKILNEIFLNFKSGSHIFLKRVRNPEQFGIALIKNKKINKIIEKPKKLISDLAITGLYLFDNKVIKLSKKLKASKRGETEITDLIVNYKNLKSVKFTQLGLGSIWSDTGTIDDFHQISNYISVIDRVQNFKISCLEEIALKQNWINKNFLKKKLNKQYVSDYTSYLKKLI